MKTSKKLSYSARIVRRNRILTAVLILMLIYMVVVGELGLGDSRMMSHLAEIVSRVIFFGGMIFVCWKIYYNKWLLKNRAMLKEQQQQENDEMRQQLYEKSGGVVWDAVLICQLFITLTASLMNMAAFYSAMFTLAVLLLAKGCRLLYLRYNAF